MKLLTALALALALALAAPSAATAQAPAAAPGEAESWTHPASGATFPRRFGGQSITEIHDSDRWDSSLVYSGSGSAVESITLYIFRAAVPDARLWFERALPSVARDIPLEIFHASADTPFSAFGAAAPNGIHRVHRTDRPGPFRTTAIAVAQAGEWLVKIRYSSASLDADAMAARIAELAGAIRFPPAALAAPLSASIPACSRPGVDGTGRPAGINEDILASAIVGGLALAGQVRQPLAAAPASWCRETGFPADRGTMLRGVADQHDWLLLLGDAGQAIVVQNGGLPGAGGADRSAVYVATPAFFRGAAIFDGSPPMMASVQAAAPILGGRSEGLFQIGPGPDGEQR